MCVWIEATPERWKLNVLATALDYRERGHATSLIVELIARATAADVETIHAEVDFDNGRMRSLLRDLGAAEFPDEDADRVYFVFRLREG